jgi:hypothetical protein
MPEKLHKDLRAHRNLVNAMDQLGMARLKLRGAIKDMQAIKAPPAMRRKAIGLIKRVDVAEAAIERAANFANEEAQRIYPRARKHFV